MRQGPARTIEEHIQKWYDNNEERWARYENVPSCTLHDIDKYCIKIPVGHFVTAVFANDLMGAMSHADTENKEVIVDICRYVYNEIPCGVRHHSYKAVDEWYGRKERK